MSLNTFAAALVAAMALAAPASAQAVITNLSLTDVLKLAGDVDGEVTESGVSDDGDFYVYVADPSELSYELNGAVCDDFNGEMRCAGLQLTAWFTLKSQEAVDEAIAVTDYAAVSDDDWGDNVFALTRYVILDGGITEANLTTNVEVFLDIANETWDILSDDGFFAE